MEEWPLWAEWSCSAMQNGGENCSLLSWNRYMYMCPSRPSKVLAYHTFLIFTRIFKREARDILSILIQRVKRDTFIQLIH